MNPVTNPYAPGAGTPPPLLAGRDGVIEAWDVVHRAGGGGELVPADRAVGAARRRQDGAPAGLPPARHRGRVVDRAVRGPPGRRPAGPDRRGAAADDPQRQPALAQQGAGRSGSVASPPASPAPSRPAWWPAASASSSSPSPATPTPATSRPTSPSCWWRSGRAPGTRASAPPCSSTSSTRCRPSSSSALIGAAHRVNQERLPVVVGGAGLPPVGRVLSEARSYAERLFSIRPVGALSPADTRRGVRGAGRRARRRVRGRRPRRARRALRRLPVLHPELRQARLGRRRRLADRPRRRRPRPATGLPRARRLVLPAPLRPGDAGRAALHARDGRHRRQPGLVGRGRRRGSATTSRAGCRRSATGC